MTSRRALAVLYEVAGLADDVMRGPDDAVRAAGPLLRRALEDLDAADPGWRERTARPTPPPPWAVVDLSSGRIVGRWATRELAEARLRPGQTIRGPGDGGTP